MNFTKRLGTAQQPASIQSQEAVVGETCSAKTNGCPQTTESSLVPPLCMGLLVFAFILVSYRILHFSVYRSDVADYINWSHHLLSYQSYPSHMPGYSAILALARTLTFGWVGDMVLARGICLTSWCLAVFLAWEITRQLAPEATHTGVLLYGLFPCVGVTIAAYPIADALSYTLFLAATFAALRKRGWAFALITSFGLLVHQAFYPFYLLLAIWSLVNHRITFTHFVFSGIPLLVYYTIVAVAENNPNWVIEYHLHTHLEASASLPVFDGIVGTFLRGGVVGLVKGTFLLAVFGCSLAFSCHFLKKRNWLMLCFLFPLLACGIVANQKISWILVRMGKLLVFPICVWLSNQHRALEILRKRSVYVGISVILVISQVAWAAYTYEYFTRNRAKTSEKHSGKTSRERYHFAFVSSAPGDLQPVVVGWWWWTTMDEKGASPRDCLAD